MPSEHFVKGQEIDVIVFDVLLDREGKPRVQLSTRSAGDAPGRVPPPPIRPPSPPRWLREWTLEEAQRQFPVGTPITGVVNNVVEFGVFVTLDEGVSALAHRSQIGPRGIGVPASHFRPGQ